MAGVKAVNPADILQAISDKLVSAGVVDSVDAISWAIDDEDPLDPTGRRLILLQWTDDRADIGWQTGGGRSTTLMRGECDVRLKTTQQLDPVGTRKDWMVDHFTKRDLITDALLGYFPVDSSNNALTIAGLRLVKNVVPRAGEQSKSKWGVSVVNLYCQYLGKLTYSVLG